MSIHKGKEDNWICPKCNRDFGSRRKLYAHWEEYPDHHIHKSTANQSDFHTCKYCKKYWKTSLAGLHIHEKSCFENPDRITRKNYGVKMSDDFCNRMSDIMKDRHKNGTAPTLSQLRRKEKPSYPEQWLMRVIENENIDSTYIREYSFYTFSLDFCWPIKRKVIEMDGRLHKISEYQKDCDKRKDELLKKEGYEELRIDWDYCCTHPKEVIQQIKDFIGE